MFTTEKARHKLSRAYPKPIYLSKISPKSHNLCVEPLVRVGPLAGEALGLGDVIGGHLQR